MKRSLSALLLFLACFPASGQLLSPFERSMIRAGYPYFSTISWAFDTAWPQAQVRSILAAQIEKESRWKPNAELCVPRPSCSREHGIGLGQFTITPAFNVFVEVSAMHPLLKGWKPSEYRDPKKQILAMVVKNRMHYLQCEKIMAGREEVAACMASSYNGGHGGVLADRRLCQNTKGCDGSRWFGHVETTSLKAKTPLQGYGQSFFQINRQYATGVVRTWSPKYTPYVGN